MTMKDYRTIVVGTDGSSLGGPTVGRAAWLAKHDDADLVIVCAYAQMSRRDEAKNIATLGGDSRIGQVLGRDAAGLALSEAMKVASAEGATVTAALLIDGEPAKALVTTATDQNADLIVLGSLHDRTLADRLLGSTSEEMIKRAHCDVLIVRPDQHRRAAGAGGHGHGIQRLKEASSRELPGPPRRAGDRPRDRKRLTSREFRGPAEERTT